MSLASAGISPIHLPTSSKLQPELQARGMARKYPNLRPELLVTRALYSCDQHDQAPGAPTLL